MTEQERPWTDWQDVYDLIDGTDYTVNDHAAREFIEKVRTEGRQQAVREIRERLESLSSNDLEHWADSILHSSDGSARVRFAAYVLGRVAGLNASEPDPEYDRQLVELAGRRAAERHASESTDD